MSEITDNQENEFIELSDLDLPDFEGNSSSSEPSQNFDTRSSISLDDYLDDLENSQNSEENPEKETSTEKIDNNKEEEETNEKNIDLESSSDVKEKEEIDNQEEVSNEIIDIEIGDKAAQELQTSDSMLNKILSSFEEGGYEAVAQKLINEGYIQIEEDGTEFSSPVQLFTDDQILMHHVKSHCRNCNEEETQEMFTRVRTMNGSEKLASDLRKDLIEKDRMLYEKEKQQQKEQFLTKIEEENKNIEGTVKSIETIGDFVNKPELVEKLSPFLHKDETGQSEFLRSIENDSIKQYKAMFFVEFEDKIKEFYDKKMQQAFEDGVASVLDASSGRVDRKVTSTPKDSKTTKRKKTIKAGDPIDVKKASEDDDFVDLSDLSDFSI